MCSRLTLVRQLREVTGAQIEAARTLRHQDLDALNSRYSDLVFQLRVAMQNELPSDPEFLVELKGETLALGKEQERLALLANSVVAILDRILPGSGQSAGTYGRDGHLMAG
jgi:hypothetical protein